MAAANTTITYKLKGSNHVGVLTFDANASRKCCEVAQAIALKLRSNVEELDLLISGTDSFFHPEEEIPAYTVLEVVRHVARTRRPMASQSAAYGSSGRGGGGGGVNSGAPSVSSIFGAPSGAMQTPAYGTAAGGDPTRELTEEERLAQLNDVVGQDTGVDEMRSQMRGRGFGRGGGGFGRGNGNFGGGGGGVMNGMQNLSSGDEEMGSFRGGGGGGGGGRGWGGNGMEQMRPPPKSYICHNCGKGGHFIQHCPEDRKGMKALSFPIGIPETMLVECSMSDPASKYITRDGRIVKRRLDTDAFVGVQSSFQGRAQTQSTQNDGLLRSDASTGVLNMDSSFAQEEKKENVDVDGFLNTRVAPSGGEAGGAGKRKRSDSPDENDGLQCVINNAHSLAQEAMLLPCCKSVVCDQCFTQYVEEEIMKDDAGTGDGLHCPKCNEAILPEEVVPAEDARKRITKLQKSGRTA